MGRQRDHALHTHDIRHWSLRKSFIITSTSLEDVESRSLMHWIWQKDRSRFGSKIGGWNGRKSTNFLTLPKTWTLQTRSRKWQKNVKLVCNDVTHTSPWHQIRRPKVGKTIRGYRSDWLITWCKICHVTPTNQTIRARAARGAAYVVVKDCHVMLSRDKWRVNGFVTS